MYVIGTAGHVDHGKSTLVHALTGIDPDRLREEKEREMTIDLGFAWLTLPNGASVGVVDVPGHRDFIENMLAGVGGIDAALFVVAADEGVMPQTREHLAILDLLEVRAGVVALTKADLAESQDWLELVSADISETLEGTVLAGAPIVPVSARTGQGLEQLVLALQEALEGVEPRPDRGQPRLPVDRVFSISGFGTVVTGTLIGGRFELGQEVEVLPQGLRGRIRGLQTHKSQVSHVLPGSRVAINLTGISKAELKRGDVVTTPGWLRPTQLVDVQLRHLPDGRWPLEHNTELKFFSGAAETVARLRLLGLDALTPGETGWAQLRLEDPLALVKGDRFIVRVPSPALTVGGGIVVDPHPGRVHRRFRPEVIARLETLARGSPEELLLQTLERLGPLPARDLVGASGLGEIAATALGRLLAEEQALWLGADATFEGPPEASRQLLVSRAWWSTQSERLVQELATYHQRYPLRAGMPREALRSSLRLEAKAFNALMARAVQAGLVEEKEALVWRAGHEVRLNPEQQARADALLAQFRRQPYAPPSLKECLAAVGDEVLGVLVDQGQIVQLSPEVVFLAETYREMVERVRAQIERDGSITLAQVRDMFDTSRKYAQSLLEYLDETGVTRRVGDARVLRSG